MKKLPYLTLLIIMCCIILTAMPARADLPLSLEDLLTEQKTFRLELGSNYSNIDSSDSNAVYGFVPVGNSFLILPVDVSTQRQNIDILAHHFGLRYGITTKTEFYTRFTATARDIRIESNTETETTKYVDKQWQDWILGVNYQFSPDNDTAAFIGFFDITAAENTTRNGAEFVYRKSAHTGFTLYRSIDPIVLSFSTGYRYSAARMIEEQEIDPSDSFYISPSFSFAINDSITMTNGIQISWTDEQKIDGEEIGIRTSQTSFSFGLGYAKTKNLTFNFSMSSNISGDNGSQIGLNLSYKL